MPDCIEIGTRYDHLSRERFSLILTARLEDETASQKFCRHDENQVNNKRR